MTAQPTDQLTAQPTDDVPTELDDDLTDDLTDGLDDGLLVATPTNYYPDVYAFVAGFLAPTFAHDVSEQDTSYKWCTKWFHHTEAVARLEALWKAWEVLRLDPGTGASVWFRDHADPCMNALTHPDGPFSRCTSSHRLPRPLPLDTPPTGLLTPATHPTAQAATQTAAPATEGES